MYARATERKREESEKEKGTENTLVKRENEGILFRVNAYSYVRSVEEVKLITYRLVDSSYRTKNDVKWRGAI